MCTFHLGLVPVWEDLWMQETAGNKCHKSGLAMVWPKWAW